MATILDELRDPNNPRSPANLTPEERAIARDLRIREIEAQTRAETKAGLQREADAVKAQAKNPPRGSGEPIPAAKRFRDAETKRFSPAPNTTVTPEEAAAARQATNTASAADDAAINERLQSQEHFRNKGRGLDRDLAPPLRGTDDVSPGAKKVIRNRNIGRLGAAGALVGGVGYLTSDGEGISPLQAGVGLGVAGAIAGKDQIAAGARKVKNTITNRREDKASYRREATLTEAGDIDGANAERRDRDLRQQQRKVIQAGDTPGEVLSQTDPEMVNPQERVMTRTNQRELSAAREMYDAAVDQQSRAAKELNQAKGAKTPNPERIAAAEKSLAAARADVKAANQLQAEIKARPQRKPSVTASVIEEAVNIKNDVPGAVDRAEKAATQKAKEVVDAADAKTKPFLKKIGDGAKDLRKKLTSKVPGLGGGGQPSAAQSVDAMMEGAPDDMPAATKSKARAGLNMATKLLTGVGTVNVIEDYVYNVREFGFQEANDRVFAGIEAIIELGGETVDDVMSGEQNVGDVVGSVLGGIITGALSLIPATVKKGANWMADAADALGMDGQDLRYARDSIYEWNLDKEYVGSVDQQALPTTNVQTGSGAPPVGLREAPPTGVGSAGGATPIVPEDRDFQVPPTNEFVGPKDIATTTMSGLRVMPAEGGLGDAPGAITQGQFLAPGSPGAPEGSFNIRGLRGSGAGNINAANAVGGAEGFDRRVEESRLAGAYEPVSQARRDEAEADLGRVRRGIDAIRDLAATQKGVPVQYLDAVRNGSLTRQQASKLGALGLRNAKGSTDPFAANKELRAQQQANREQYLFEQGVNQTGMDVLNEIGADLGAAASDNAEEQASVKRNFATWAAAWMPEASFDRLKPHERGRIVGEYSLLTHLAKSGEGFWRGLNPFAPEVNAEDVTNPGESILETMMRQGTLLDIRDNNILFMGTDESGKPVPLSTTISDMPPDARTAVNTFKANNPEFVNQLRTGLR